RKKQFLRFVPEGFDPGLRGSGILRHLAAEALDFSGRITDILPEKFDQSDLNRLFPGLKVPEDPEELPDDETEACRSLILFQNSRLLPWNQYLKLASIGCLTDKLIAVPFADRLLLEFALSLPWQEQLRGRCSKSVLRCAYSEDLPHEVTGRSKQGFRLPLAKWMGLPELSFVYDYACENSHKLGLQPELVREIMMKAPDSESAAERAWLLFSVILLV
ncbi:MAG: asparagine synthase-related protein, partial [Candidatus Wallbacteria bacterium]|nr:asparagine synthase-related protein [Candidatus Wallbacteria bacterium]